MYNNVKAITPTTRLKIFIEYNPSSTLISPTIVSSPKIPPLIFPASYEAFPTTIADKMSSIINLLAIGCFISDLITSDNPF